MGLSEDEATEESGYNSACSNSFYVCAGVVPANGKVDIFITFTPAEYNTATIELQVSLLYMYARLTHYALITILPYM